MKGGSADLRQRWKGLDPDLLPVDDTDMGILSLLVENSRETFSDMAAKLDTTEATVRRRVRALMDRGLILGFTTRINFAAIENTVRAFIHLSVAPGRLREVVNQLRAHQRVLEVNRVTGQKNILIISRFVSIAELRSFVDDFLRMDGVTDTEVQIVMGTHKEAPWGGP